MSVPDSITIRPIRDDEIRDFLTAIRDGFGSDGPPEDTSERFRSILPAERTLAAFDGDRIVGTFGGFDMQLTVPGGAQVPMEGTTIVTVFPTHRRMGLLSAMMGRHLEHAASEGYPIAGLWSSDADIYARFGYGIATHYRSVKMHAGQIDFRGEVPIDRVRRITPDEAGQLLPDVFDRIRRTRPGMTSRSASWWEHRIILDEPWMAEGKTKRRWVVHDGPDGIDGYASYRQKSGFEAGYNKGSVSIIDVQSETSEAHASLWSYLTRVDGFPEVEYDYLPLDDPLPRMIVEPRRVVTTETRDALWIRILDVKAALEARSYEYDGSLVIGVEDRFRPEGSGSFRLQVEEGSATVERVDVEPEIQLADDVLGALYLGGQSAHSYASARRIMGSPDSIALTDRLFRTMRAPWIQEVF
jgi:predicted acetyltransferase